ncbi:alpha/beta hydrolase family protein [Hoeflea alexandrii]|uniref:alpha/beta hydrolase family protein n=1 Tax=Hoeflea alexandrii TaxID=288436 RepID=UPI0022B072F6|nr:prolyl oligopeptidase family serine peptidase [Hoeflea alexandrii]MCZ4290811.1 prolyl oligopeptidase family serine peptidase [Hoeflea alexandrii]
MKKLLVLIVAFSASFCFLYMLVSMDQPARHAGLKAAQLPPLIAIHNLFSAHSGSGADGAVQETASNPGTKIGWKAPSATESAVSAILTLPQTGSYPGPLPTVVMVDSRPKSGTSQDHERTVRFLANRGYAVLSIDCGALADNSGVPDAQAGFQTTGGCTAATIRDEARRLTELEIADKAALAVIGSGLGGYLALMSMALEPSLFKAAILHSTGMDRAPSAPDSQIAFKPQKAVATGPMQLGLPDQGEISSAIPAQLELAQRIESAVLITHGNADTVAPAEHAHILARALRNSGNHVETAFFNHEDHCYSRWQTRVQVARLQETFLAHQLGGRNGGYDYIELLAKLF